MKKNKRTQEQEIQRLKDLEERLRDNHAIAVRACHMLAERVRGRDSKLLLHEVEEIFMKRAAAEYAFFKQHERNPTSDDVLGSD